MLPIIYAAAIFSVVTVGGLEVLRRLPNAVLRAVLFVVLCYVLLRGTFWLAGRWSLNPVELGYAWAVALLLAVAVEIVRVRRGKRSRAT
jgi:hypothetical protein